MKRALWGILLLAPLGACTVVNERLGYAEPGYAAPGYTAPGYVQQGQGYAAPGYGAPVATPGYRDGSYEAERQAYEYGRRDGAARAQGFR